MSSNKQFCIAIRHVCTSGKLPLQAKASPKNSQLCCRAVTAARELFADVRQLVAQGAADVRRRVCRDQSCGRLQGFPELFAAWSQLKLLSQQSLHTTAGCCESQTSLQSNDRLQAVVALSGFPEEFAVRPSCSLHSCSSGCELFAKVDDRHWLATLFRALQGFCDSFALILFTL